MNSRWNAEKRRATKSVVLAIVLSLLGQSSTANNTKPINLNPFNLTVNGQVVSQIYCMAAPIEGPHAFGIGVPTAFTLKLNKQNRNNKGDLYFQFQNVISTKYLPGVDRLAETIRSWQHRDPTLNVRATVLPAYSHNQVDQLTFSSAHKVRPDHNITDRMELKFDQWRRSISRIDAGQAFAGDFEFLNSPQSLTPSSPELPNVLPVLCRLVTDRVLRILHNYFRDQLDNYFISGDTEDETRAWIEAITDQEILRLLTNDFSRAGNPVHQSLYPLVSTLLQFKGTELMDPRLGSQNYEQFLNVPEEDDLAGVDLEPCRLLLAKIARGP